MNRTGMFHCSSKYHIMAKYHTIALCGEISYRWIVWRNIIPLHCGEISYYCIVWRNIIPLSSNILRPSLVTMPARFSYYICAISLLSRCAKDRASARSSSINPIDIMLLLQRQPMELKGFTVWPEPRWPLHCSFIEWQVKHRDANSGECLVVRGDIEILYLYCRLMVNIRYVEIHKLILGCVVNMLIFVCVIVGKLLTHRILGFHVAPCTSIELSYEN
jgi:hypothetical protein